MRVIFLIGFVKLEISLHVVRRNCPLSSELPICEIALVDNCMCSCVLLGNINSVVFSHGSSNCELSHILVLSLSDNKPLEDIHVINCHRVLLPILCVVTAPWFLHLCDLETSRSSIKIPSALKRGPLDLSSVLDSMLANVLLDKDTLSTLVD